MSKDGKNKLEQKNQEQQSSGNGDPLHHVKSISGMYQNWFLDYASYVILERAVPHVLDGLKPVQRRILHAMKRLDDGRYNKVANIIGYTMQYHPHGDASIGDALVQLGQKDLLIDTQGNWGNILTGDNAAAPRYIEARLSKFAQEVIFNPKTTDWKLSYDGRNKEPVALPAKFPLLLAQGVEGIAVGLASKILPHNFNELIDAAIAHLKGKDFELYPDFFTGGMIDVSRYNDGLRGGKVRIRAKIKKEDKRTLTITEIPFGKNTSAVIDSILNANDKGKIKIKKIDDNTAEKVEIVVHLSPNVSSDKTIDALYAFTDCEVSISPNACVIEEDKPIFMKVGDILKASTQNTLELLRLELKIRMQELKDDWHKSSLEKIFIENRLYLDIEDCETWEEILETIDKGLEPFKHLLKREVVEDDLIRLTEIKIKRISKYDSFKADEHIKALEIEMKEIQHNLDNIVDFTIAYYKRIKKKYGKGRERKTEIRSFDTIEATKVVAKNEKLYINRKEGFIGTSLKRDEYLFDCSDIDDIIVFRRDGTYFVTKVQEKFFIGKNPIHVSRWKRGDERTIYNVLYLDGKTGNALGKRFAVKAVTRDKEYDLTKGHENSKVLYFTANPNGEAETIKITHKPKPRLRNIHIELDFSDLAIRSRNANGNIITRHGIHKINLVDKGVSTLGGRKIWFDNDVQRLNADERGKYLGEFKGDDKILVITQSGTFKLYSYELTNHFPKDIIKIEKYNNEKIFSALYYEGEIDFYYVKRFPVEESDKPQYFIGEHKNSFLVDISEDKYPRAEIIFGGEDSHREKEYIDVEEYIGVKSYRARGKRLTNYEVKSTRFVEPLIKEDDVENYKNSQHHNDPDFEIIRPKDEDQGQLEL